MKLCFPVDLYSAPIISNMKDGLLMWHLHCTSPFCASFCIVRAAPWNVAEACNHHTLRPRILYSSLDHHVQTQHGIYDYHLTIFLHEVISFNYNQQIY